MTDGWDVISIKRLTLHRSNRLANMYVLSPYVWRADDKFHLMVRAVPRRDDEPRLKMSEIWYGVSDDGREFTMDAAPAIFPGPDLIDLDGCEDPTVLAGENVLRIWYTGYNEKQKTGRLLAASGQASGRLTKSGIAIESTPGFEDPKEAALAPIGSDGWALFFEFSRDEASVIGRVSADTVDGPWQGKCEAALKARTDGWDSWHMSPGPIIGMGTEQPVMFYNGSTREADWRIGWARFNAKLDHVVARSTDPLIEPDDDLPAGENDIVFVASAVEDGAEVLLYFSHADQDLRVARIKRQ